MNSVDFRLPWPPTVNTYYVCIRSRKVLSKKGREYTKVVRDIIEKAGMDYGIDEPLVVELQFAPPRDDNWDLDNRVKSLFDSLTKAGFWTDDSLVHKFSAEKLPKYAMGEVYISVYLRSDENE